MNSKAKNIIIFLIIIGIAFLAYLLFLNNKNTENDANLISSSEVKNNSQEGRLKTGFVNSEEKQVAKNTEGEKKKKEFLNLVLSVQGINLDDSIFSDIAFTSLRDSSILLIPTGNEGRPNPFAPLGSDRISLPVNNLDEGVNLLQDN